jgi:hypothetical protein
MPIIPATWEAEIGRIKTQDQLGQKLIETPPNQIVVTHNFNPIYVECVSK